MKISTIFVCTECGRQLLKWAGKCPNCGNWNTVVEKQAPGRKGNFLVSSEDRSGHVMLLSEMPPQTNPRLKTNIGELDRVLGGGLVKRSVILVGGDPGIGKSTLLMQALASVAQNGSQVLYVSGEESSEQLKLRAERLGINTDRFLVLVENELEVILDRLKGITAAVVVIDSVQAIFSRSVQSHPGSISQVREVADQIVGLIKRGDASCFLVGHVTKDGTLAGPRVLEHMVDTVLYFEGDRGHPYRILRAVKNRFGSSSEIGVFEMNDVGLREVSNPSEVFISERPEETSGSTVTAVVEGTRPILAEIQALVTGPVPGQGRRTCLGVDPQRLALMIAVIEKKLGLILSDHDIFLNAVGGIRAIEPATDLAVVAALLSSFLDRTVPKHTLIFGEVGLGGEIRRVSRAPERIKEAARLGFREIVAPALNCEQGSFPVSIRTTGLTRINELVQKLFP